MISRYTRCLLLVNPIVYHKSNLWGEESKTTDAYIKESSTYVKYSMRIPILRSSLQYSDRSSKNSIYSNSTHMGLFYGLLQNFSSRYICISCIAEQNRSSISKYLVYLGSTKNSIYQLMTREFFMGPFSLFYLEISILC